METPSGLDPEDDLSDDEDLGQLERTDVDSDELLDGEVDADGASAIRHRNE